MRVSGVKEGGEGKRKAREELDGGGQKGAMAVAQGGKRCKRAEKGVTVEGFSPTHRMRAHEHPLCFVKGTPPREPSKGALEAPLCCALHGKRRKMGEKWMRKGRERRGKEEKGSGHLIGHD